MGSSGRHLKKPAQTIRRQVEKNDIGGNAMPLEEKGGSNQIKRVLASECSSCGLVQTPPQTAGLFKRRPKPNPFFKNIPRRIFKDQRDAEGVPFRRDPLYPLNEFEAVIRSRWVEFVP
jgi:hypothetical protein